MTGVRPWGRDAANAERAVQHLEDYQCELQLAPFELPLRPALIEHVLLDNAANYVKPDIVKKLLRRTIGSGLLSSDGELWRRPPTPAVCRRPRFRPCRPAPAPRRTL